VLQFGGVGVVVGGEAAVVGKGQKIYIFGR